MMPDPIAMGLKPDAAIWDAKRMRAVVMNAKLGTVVTIDPVSAKITKTITLKPGLDFAVIDPRGMLYINNEDDSDISIVDLDRAKLVATVALPGCKSPWQGRTLGYSKRRWARLCEAAHAPIAA